MTHRSSLPHYSLALAAAGCVVFLGSNHAAAQNYVQTNLVSDIPGLADVTDPSLVNPWGVSESGTSPFWISNQGTSTSTLYSVTGSTTVSKVNINPPADNVLIPTTATGPQGPTGQVAPTSSNFLVGDGGNGGAAHFIFSNLNGTISAWDTGTTSFVQATTPGAVYTGLAMNTAGNMLYAANDAGAGGINVFNSSFVPVIVPGAFTDPNLPAGFVPFNVRDINGNVYVTYAPSGRTAQTSATAGMGFVDVYSESGTLLQRLVSGSALASPWGVALAPDNFGEFSGDLLVGNFSFDDSGINAFDPSSGAFLGSIPFDDGGNNPGGLWDLTFGNGSAGGSLDTLFVTDGLNGETDGLFAAIDPVAVPEPSSMALLGAGFVGLGMLRRIRRRAA